MRADFVLDYNTVAINKPQKLNLMARFVSAPVASDRQRRPLNLCLVIDRSGSMAGDKIDYTRQAGQFLVQNLSSQDIFSVVLYNDKIETLLMPENVHRKDAIAQRLGTIKAGGTTNLSSGWLEGCSLVARNLSDQYVNRVILMSDGLANRGVTDQDQLVAMARTKFDEKVTTTTMGLGNDFNEDLMMAMASAGGGAFYFIESPEVTPLIFQEELQGLLNVVGQNLTVSIRPTEHVRIVTQLNAYPMHSDGEWMSFRLGDVFGDEVKGLLLEMSLHAIPSQGQMQIATLRFEYDELQDQTTDHHQVEIPVMVQVGFDDGVPKLPDAQVEQSVLLLKAANARKRAIKSADRGEFEGASQVLRDVASIIEKSQSNDPRLLEERKALLAQANEVEQGESKYSSYDRKTMATQAFYTMTSRHQDTMMLRVRESQRKGGDSPPKDAPGDAPKTEPKPRPEAIHVESREGVTPTHVSWNEKTFALDGNLIRIGRSRHNEIVLLANGVSRFHCQVRRDGDQLLLEDLGSTNGTMISGTIIDQPHILNVGDVAYLCDEKLIFHDGTNFAQLEG